MPQVSVILPVYNSQNTIKRAVHSVLSQTFSDFELVIIDDGSTDNTPSLLKGLASSDSRIHLFTQENSGVSLARNQGMLFAKGEWLVFIDSDDYWENDLLEKNIPIDGNEYDFIEFGFFWKEREEKRIESPSLELSLPDDAKEIFQGGLPTYYVWNKLLKRTIIQDGGVRFPQISIGEDQLFLIDYFHHVKKGKRNRGCYYHYSLLTEGSLSFGYKEDLKNASLLFLRELKSIQEKRFPQYPEIYEKEVLRVSYSLLVNEAFAVSEKKKNFHQAKTELNEMEHGFIKKTTFNFSSKEKILSVALGVRGIRNILLKIKVMQLKKIKRRVRND